MLAGGVEVMSRVPMGSDGGAWAMDPDTSYTTGFVPQGIGADLIATLEGFTREDVDTFAVESQTRAAKAWANGYFAKSVVPVKDRNGLPILDRDEHIRAGATLESLGRAAAVVRDDGRGGRLRRRRAAALPLGREDRARPPRGQQLRHRRRRRARARRHARRRARASGLTPRARIVATALSGADPTIMLTGPAPASRKALAKAGLTVDDIDLFEINEAFAAVAMRYMKDMGISHEQTNVNGGVDRHGPPARRDRGDDPRHPRSTSWNAATCATGPRHAVRRRRHGHRDDRGACLSGGRTAGRWEGRRRHRGRHPRRPRPQRQHHERPVPGGDGRRCVDELAADPVDHRRDRHVGQEDVLRRRRPGLAVRRRARTTRRRSWPTSPR